MFKQDDHFSYKNCYQYGSCKLKKFNDGHNSSRSHHCGVHIKITQSETYSPRSWKLILQSKKGTLPGEKPCWKLNQKFLRASSHLLAEHLCPRPGTKKWWCVHTFGTR